MTNTTNLPHTSTGIVCGRCSTKGANAVIRRHATIKDVAACFAIGYAPKVEVPAPAAPVVTVNLGAPAPKSYNRYSAKCSQKGCKRHAVRGVPFRFKCPDHTWVRVQAKQLVGTLSTSAKHKCDPRCTGAVGNVCVCQCGGQNHGADLLIKM